MNKLLIALLMSLSLIVTACSDSGSGKSGSNDDGSDDSTKTEEIADSDENDGEEDELDENGEKKKKKQAVPVEVVSVARGDIQQTYRTITTLEAEVDAEVDYEGGVAEDPQKDAVRKLMNRLKFGADSVRAVTLCPLMVHVKKGLCSMYCIDLKMFVEAAMCHQS